MNTAIESTVTQNFDNMIIYSNLLEDISKPIFKLLNIANFGFVELYASGHWRMFNTKDDMFAESAAANFLNDAPSRILDAYQTPGCYLLDIEQELKHVENDVLNMLYKYGYQNSFRIMSIDQDTQNPVMRLFCYEGSKSDAEMNSTFINNIELLKKFNQHVIQRMQSTCRNDNMLELKPVDITKAQNLFAIHESRPFIIEPEQYQTKKEHSNKPLSAQQTQVIQWYLKGHTANETAALMGISRRTVERHFEILRKKYNCRTKYELICVLTDSGLLANTATTPAEHA